jgi:hypothetical protein
MGTFLMDVRVPNKPVQLWNFVGETKEAHDGILFLESRSLMIIGASTRIYILDISNINTPI